jgi:CRISPR-associated protein Cas2
MWRSGDAIRVGSFTDPTRFTDFLTAGRNRCMPVDFDGLKLVSFHPEKPA